MVLAAEDPTMWIGLASYVLGFIGAPLLARHKNLGPIMYVAGILGLLGLIAVALAAPRCRECGQTLSPEQLRRRSCPRCRRGAAGDGDPD